MEVAEAWEFERRQTTALAASSTPQISSTPSPEAQAPDPQQSPQSLRQLTRGGLNPPRKP